MKPSILFASNARQQRLGVVAGSPLRLSMPTVEHLMATRDLVFAVWPDTCERDGVGVLMLKGQGTLAAIVEAGQTATPTLTAFAVDDAAEAAALAQAIGEKPH
jgi:hypothetical protein